MVNGEISCIAYVYNGTKFVDDIVDEATYFMYCYSVLVKLIIGPIISHS